MSTEIVGQAYKMNNAREAFDAYEAAGFDLVPVPPGRKGPSIRKWEVRLFERGEFAPEGNIGVKGGKPVTVDLDEPEAVEAAHSLLAPTLRSGHGGQFGHRHYHAPDLPENFYHKLTDHDGATLVEIRGASNKQTLLPPSMHPNGDRYEWDGDFDPSKIATISADDLLHRVRMIATTAIIARNLPDGGKHDLSLAFAGLLLENGMDDEDADEILKLAWEIAGAHHDGDLFQAVPDTREKIDNDEPYTRGRHVDELLGKLVSQAIRKVWGWGKRNKRTGFACTDMGNAERLAHHHGDNIRYIGKWGKFLYYDGKRWIVADNGEIHRLAKDTVRTIYPEAGALEDENARKALANWAKSSESASKIRAMIDMVKSEPGIAAKPEDFDRDPMLLNCENGTIDLRTGALREHRREDMLTKLAPVRYDKDAKAPSWNSTVARALPRYRLRKFVQRALGYTLTGDTGEQALFIPHGGGANSKSTILEAVMSVMGGYATTAAQDLLMEKDGSHPTEIADLHGARLVLASEVKEGARLDEPKIKRMTGDRTLKARRMREDFWEFEKTFKIWMPVNHKPHVKETTNAVWRRIKLVPFTVTIPEDEQDKRLPEKLRAELPGILAWLVRGCLRWQQEGLGVPPEVKDATDEYRSEMDVLSAFIEDKCAVHPNARVAAGDLYIEYQLWCDQNGEYAGNQRNFGSKLRERGFEKCRPGGVHSWRGIGIRYESKRPSLRVGEWELFDDGTMSRRGIRVEDEPYEPEDPCPVPYRVPSSGTNTGSDCSRERYQKKGHEETQGTPLQHEIASILTEQPELLGWGDGYISWLLNDHGYEVSEADVTGARRLLEGATA